MDRWTIQPDEVSWASWSVTLRLPRPVTGGGHVQLRLRTDATDGCYGVLVGAAADRQLRDSRYAAVVDGRTRTAARAQMLVFP